MKFTRECVACGGLVPEGYGVYHADLGRLSHAGACDEVVSVCRRDYSRSKRGRWRSRGAVLRLLRHRRDLARRPAILGVG
jgi:hypothetical protein